MEGGDSSLLQDADPCSIPTISYRALQRARTTLEDFSKTYFMFHGLSLPEDFFRYLDVLVYVEATIYHLDEVNEDLCRKGVAEDADLPGAAVLVQTMEKLNLLDERIRHEINKGFSYWAHERNLMKQMLDRKHCLSGPPAEFTEADIITAHKAKSFDYRVLNLLLFRLTDTPVDEALLQFLRVDEMLVDIGDDLVDYEDDVEANSFNIYRGFIHVHGREAELKLVERVSSLEAEHARLLQQLPADLQDKYRQRQAEAGLEPGSARWSFPPPIYDEELFRSRVRETAAGQWS